MEVEEEVALNKPLWQALKKMDVVALELMAAVNNGDVEVVKLLLDYGANVHKIYDRGALHSAANNGNAAIIKLLLERGATMDSTDVEGRTPLLIASQFGHLEAVAVLLDGGANVNLVGNEGNSPLHIATESNNLEVMKLLLDRGASINLANNSGLTPISIAAANGKVEVVELLLIHGASKVTANGVTPLYIAADAGHLEVAELLLKHGARINFGNIRESNSAPIMAAARKGQLDMVKFFIDRGASFDLENLLRALTQYAKRDTLEMVKLLVDWGVDVNLPDGNGNTPLHDTSSVDMMKALVLHGAKINVSNGEDSTPLHVVLYGYEEVFERSKFLLQHGGSASIYVVNKYGNTPLNEAISKHNLYVVKLLLEHNATVDENCFNVALTASLKLGRTSIAYLLLRKCTKVAITDPKVIHLITSCTSNKSNKVLKLLLDCGVDVNWVDKTPHERVQHTALHLALLNKQPIKVRYLMLYGADASSKSVWDMSKGSNVLREALLHFWTPTTHQYHPDWAKEAIFSLLLIARRQQWLIDRHVMFKIFSYVAYGWYKSCFAAGMHTDHFKPPGRAIRYLCKHCKSIHKLQ